jgi:SAM-dependent methyltransferase
MPRRRRINGPPKAGTKRLPDPLEELISISEREAPIRAEHFFELVNRFAFEKRKHRENLEEQERFIREAYDAFSPPERVRFFSMLYDRFAERYDEHMGIETKHYWAIERVVGYAAPYLKLPIFDPTAGTGEPLLYAARLMPVKGVETDLTYMLHANEVSHKMLEKAEGKLAGIPGAGFTDYSAYELPGHLKERFRTVLCSQTFHIISDEDKQKMVRSINEALLPGGHAIIIEEDPFRISQTPPIEAVSLFLRSVVRPVKHPGKLIGFFVTNGFTKLEERAVAPIDEHHVMRLHIFSKD